MASNLSTVIINASKQRVWDTLTKPELIKLWQYGSNVLTDWQVGSKIEFVTEWEDKIFKQWGTVLSFSPAESLSYSLFAPRPGVEDKPENYFVMKYVLTDAGDQIKLEIIQEDNRPHAVQEEPQGEENPILQGLKRVAELNG
ncbi:MAG: ATPase [Cyclobacteriaceae bacterium]|nr:ATPase [Cyclobacteriaceae bacterium]